MRFLRDLAWLLLALCLVPPLFADWKQAVPGWTYEFPRDEYAHPDFKTEWWYFTGNLREISSGRRFGYQLTFFRQGIRPPGSRPAADSKFVTDHFWFAHCAISDLQPAKFHATEAASRGAFGEAGSGTPDRDPRLAWVENWSVSQPGPGHYDLNASADQFAISLRLSSQKPPVFHGADGVSAKSADSRNASHYYSQTRLASTGTIRIGGQTYEVEGQSWFDREWSTSVLGKDIAGWDWFSIQLRDNVELMLFQLRRTDGTAAFTSGTLVESGGSTTSLPDGSIQLTPLRRSAGYPIDWRAKIPSIGLELTVTAAMPDQELRLSSVTYWEGATQVQGSRDGKTLSGSGYLEMTGYRGALAALR
jgi:predicted secreted hydrolase